MGAFLVQLLAIGCAEGPTGRPERPPRGGGRDDAPEQVGASPQAAPYDFLFSLDRVHEVDIELDTEASNALYRDPDTYVEGAVTIDGERVDGVGVRLKGSGSFQSLEGKAAFKIDFDRFQEGGNFHGLGKLTLNNMFHDDAQTHDVVAMAAFRAVGLEASRVGYAWVTVNGDDYGLYANVETPAKEWVDDHFSGGRLYEGGMHDGVSFADFTDAISTQQFDLEVGDDVAWADLLAVTKALKTPQEDRFMAEYSKVVHVDDYARYQLTEAWTGHGDGYILVNNFRVLVDVEGDGKLHFVPSGTDLCFGLYDGVDMSSSAGALGRACTAHADCQGRFVALAPEVVDTLENAGLDQLLDDVATLIQPYVEADPRRNVPLEGVAPAQEAMHQWMEDRGEQVLDWYSG